MLKKEAERRALRLLIVDDNLDATFTLSMLLELKGYEVHSRNSGKEGVLAAGSLKPDVVLLDIGMPQMNGYETCQEMRKQPWGKDLFIVAVSGYGQHEDKQNAKAVGFDDHLTKPIDLNALLQLLSKLA
ncbi:hypothetical protein BWI97_25470 [Siphonobacter sp. BAB-5405]|uniref:response regulator n=1 Tax=Siphonobacter sp. BAB-5405 TaxID=1864825 RepID=UPI000C80EC4C|nr:response regulator [Siphonobacter sp. BAB-5405]PMD88022.1 hypothetical protein BWI97_25470 [Siphonobacter sp. BAB-5405]